MFVLVCYDIPDDRRRAKVGETLEAFGYRVQKSVFECEITPQQRQEMQKRLQNAIEPSQDSIRYYVLCQNCLSAVEIAGLGAVQRNRLYYVV
ncbi:MAG: CRISPR-associated endonuclease Cas2 [Dehalococcoidia bacterium]|nr:CRISPR-associated endonuclease Cas2 [Dehalococcoidia bacterium]